MQKYQDLRSFRLPPSFRGRAGWYVQLWWIVQSTLFAMSPQFMYRWRRWLLRLFGADVGSNALIRPTVKVTFPWKVSIGENAWIGDDVVLYSLGEITIGHDAVISQRSYLCSGGHDYSLPSFDIFARPIHIGPQAWIATDVFVAPGVYIGEGAIIGARSTVLHDQPAGMMCFGNPAKPVRPRTEPACHVS